jgi:hypothetical protein
VENWAVSKGINTLSFWALERDNGDCPGTAGAGSCSGVPQSAWYFSHAFEPFTSDSRTKADDFPALASPSSASAERAAQGRRM